MHSCVALSGLFGFFFLSDFLRSCYDIHLVINVEAARDAA